MAGSVRIIDVLLLVEDRGSHVTGWLPGTEGCPLVGLNAIREMGLQSYNHRELNSARYRNGLRREPSAPEKDTLADTFISA